MSIRSIFNDYTIVHVLDNSRIQEESKQSKDSDLSAKCRKGICVGIERFIPSIVIAFVISNLARSSFGASASNATSQSHSIDSVITAPIIEELIFRGILRNGVCCAQKFAKWAASGFIKNTRVFEWLTSPSARILGTHSLFALAHLRNAGTYLSTAGTVAQVGNILLMPGESILYETTGSIAAPILCHMTNNLLVITLGWAVYLCSPRR